MIQATRKLLINSLSVGTKIRWLRIRQRNLKNSPSSCLALSLCLVSIVLVCGVTNSCGGASNSTSGQTGGPYNVVGDWRITVSVTGGNSTNAYGVISSSGLALFFDSDGDTIELPTINGAISFSGSMISYGPPGLNVGSDTVSAKGNVNSPTSITGTFTAASPNPSGTFSIGPYSGLSPVVTLSGAMVGQIASEAVILDLNFSPSGANSSMTFTGSNGFNCDVSGTFFQEGGDVSTLNIFDVSMTFSGTGCPTPTTSAISGIGFESASDYFYGKQNGTYLYADMLDPAGAFAMEIFQQGVAPAGAASKLTPAH